MLSLLKYDSYGPSCHTCILKPLSFIFVGGESLTLHGDENYLGHIFKVLVGREPRKVTERQGLADLLAEGLEVRPALHWGLRGLVVLVVHLLVLLTGP